MTGVFVLDLVLPFVPGAAIVVGVVVLAVRELRGYRRDVTPASARLPHAPLAWGELDELEPWPHEHIRLMRDRSPVA